MLAKREAMFACFSCHFQDIDSQDTPVEGVMGWGDEVARLFVEGWRSALLMTHDFGTFTAGLSHDGAHVADGLPLLRAINSWHAAARNGNFRLRINRSIQIRHTPTAIIYRTGIERENEIAIRVRFDGIRWRLRSHPHIDVSGIAGDASIPQ